MKDYPKAIAAAKSLSKEEWGKLLHGNDFRLKHTERASIADEERYLEGYFEADNFCENSCKETYNDEYATLYPSLRGKSLSCHH